MHNVQLVGDPGVDPELSEGITQYIVYSSMFCPLRKLKYSLGADSHRQGRDICKYSEGNTLLLLLFSWNMLSVK